MVHHFKRALLATLLPAAMLASGGQTAMAQDIGCAVAAEDGVNFAPKGRIPSEQTLSEDGTTTFINTPEGPFESVDPFANTPTNLLPTVYEEAIDCGGDPIPNTLPSTPEDPYNLHPDPVVTEIDKTSPTDDLDRILDLLELGVGATDPNAVDLVAANPPEVPSNGRMNQLIQDAIDILEGNELKRELSDRAYEGFPMLHYNGPDKTKAVEPILDENGNVVGGNIDVHQIWFDNHIEADTFAIDPSAVQDVPWQITYTVDVLNKGHEDWAPMAMFFDDPQDRTNPNTGGPVPHVTMDMSFFPMEDGQRYVFELQMPPGRFWNLTYHWGWRIHPPRVQVFENALKAPGGKTIPQWEIDVFGENPTGSRRAQLEAIDMIGDIAPAKRMWNAFRTLQRMSLNSEAAVDALREARRAFLQWQDRTKLPDGVEADPEADVTLLYANNTIYGEMPGFVEDHQMEWFEWRTRPATLTVKLYNGDYFPHAYQNVDFGGRLGWENTFQNTIPIGGQGPWFTFGRFHWMPRVPMPPMVPPAERPGGGLQNVVLPTVPDIPGGAFEEVSEGVRPFRPAMAEGLTETADARTLDGLGMHTVEVTYNYEPSRRLRFYQFDPLHHDVAIWSVH